MTNGKHTFENEALGPDLGPEEIDALKKRIYFLKPNIILLEEVALPSIPTIKIFVDRLQEVANQKDNLSLIIDLQKTSRPNAELRAYIKNSLSRVQAIKKIALVTGNNFIMNIAAEFILHRSKFSTFSVHKNLDQAIEAIENDQQKRSK